LITGFSDNANTADVTQFVRDLQAGCQVTEVVRSPGECYVGLFCPDEETAKTAAFKANHKLFGTPPRTPLQAQTMLQDQLRRTLRDIKLAADPETSH